jgi:hypothetical protein
LAARTPGQRELILPEEGDGAQAAALISAAAVRETCWLEGGPGAGSACATDSPTCGRPATPSRRPRISGEAAAAPKPHARPPELPSLRPPALFAATACPVGCLSPAILPDEGQRAWIGNVPRAWRQEVEGRRSAPIRTLDGHITYSDGSEERILQILRGLRSVIRLGRARGLDHGLAVALPPVPPARQPAASAPARTGNPDPRDRCRYRDPVALPRRDWRPGGGPRREHRSRPCRRAAVRRPRYRRGGVRITR